MTKEEAVALAIFDQRKLDSKGSDGIFSYRPADMFREAAAAIAAADKWEAEQSQPEISQGFDDALQAELDHPPASILGKE